MVEQKEKSNITWGETIHNLIEVLLMSGAVWGMPILFVPFQKVIDENRCEDNPNCESSMMFITLMYTVVSFMNAISMFGVGLALNKIKNLNLVLEVGVTFINLSTGILVLSYTYGSAAMYGIGLLLQGTFSPFIFQPSLVKSQLHRHSAVVSSLMSFFNSISGLVPVVAYYAGGVIFGLAYLGVCTALMVWGAFYVVRTARAIVSRTTNDAELKAEEVVVEEESQPNTTDIQDKVPDPEGSDTTSSHRGILVLEDGQLHDDEILGQDEPEAHVVVRGRGRGRPREQGCCCRMFSFVKSRWFIALSPFCVSQLFTSTMFTSSINAQLEHRGVTDPEDVSLNITIFYASQACGALLAPLVGLGIKRFGPVVGFLLSGLLGCVGYGIIEFGPVSVGLVLLAFSIPCFFAGAYNYVGGFAEVADISTAIATVALLLGIGAMIASFTMSSVSGTNYFRAVNCTSMVLEFLLLTVMAPLSKLKAIIPHPRGFAGETKTQGKGQKDKLVSGS